MFFKRTPEEGKWTHIIIFTRGRAGAYTGAYMGREMGKEWAGMGKEADYGSGKKHQDLF
ncbi:hypothetical protein [Phocaeicola sartorii]|uniref:hypothetical protein n=1 Tax=Phocaeicola sartorii TaxID=671267 RepID=UPI001F579E26|nr:hypothetical protein [Phocaeicola sartorii]